MSCKTYIKEAIRLVEKRMVDFNLSYPSTRRHGKDTPFSSSAYRPEHEESEMCNENEITLYQNLIGMLRWMCELGRIDILYETALLSQYLVSPRKGHLLQALNIFRYLKGVKRNWLVLDTERFEVSWVPMKEEPHPKERALAMKKIYPDAVKEEPLGAPEPLGEPVSLTIFTDADHAGDKLTRRSHTGTILMINSAIINWYSKKQNVVETSTFGAELIALRTALEMTEALVYKLTMLGVKVDDTPVILCDNSSVVINTSYPESLLKKKHLSIAYHRIREAVAM